MPTRQDTFKLVPTTLVNTSGPRPPMTSKAAKKAYREANKLPKISKAEQRRIEAAEIARQKKEYEKEKAAAKAKAAREKKLKKEAEERAKRKELGLPEPSRFVRPSQPTIKTFVKSGAARKRSWEDVAGKAEDDTDTGTDDNDEYKPKRVIEKPAKRISLEREDDEDEFGDFPSLSQADLPSLFAEPEDTSRTVSIKSSPSKLPMASSQVKSIKCEATDHMQTAVQVKLDGEKANNQVLMEAIHAMMTAPSMQQCQFPTVIPTSTLKKHTKIAETSTELPCTVPRPHAPKTTTPAIQANAQRKSADGRPRATPPPALPMTVNRLGSRTPLAELSRNMAPPPRPPKVQAAASKCIGAKSSHESGRQNMFQPPPSTLAYLEAHLDDFFPSPSQQVRELLEDVDDMPSNTQIAREINVGQASLAVRAPHIPSPLPQSQVQMEDEKLNFFSSQDLEISSQDLRDLDTPSKAISKKPLLRDLTTPMLLIPEPKPAPPPTPKLKPRFFEEKEDDLLYAALHESLLLSKHMTQGSSPRRSQRILRRTQSVKTDHGCDEYGSDGSDLDAELLALLDKA